MPETSYSRKSPFLGKLKKQVRLTAPHSEKEVHHLEICLSGSGINYSCGDSIGILPENPKEHVEKTLKALKIDFNTPYHDSRSDQTLPIGSFLTKHADITTVSKKIAEHVLDSLPAESPKSTLHSHIANNDRQEIKSYLAERELWDFLLEHSNSNFDPHVICSHLKPLMPRFYSIASSQNVVGDEVHLTVAQVSYVTNGHKRYGVTTRWLCEPVSDTLPGKTIPLFLHPANGFSLPEKDEAPVIMIGPGTGIAPFRAFIQERLARKATGKQWLFFGEWTEDGEFLYGDYLSDLAQKGDLHLSTAFSRDQEEKVYVQHRLLEHGKQIIDWLDEGAHLYVCGDASKMAKDVEEALSEILQKHKNFDESTARDHLKSLRKSGRYMKDVY